MDYFNVFTASCVFTIVTLACKNGDGEMFFGSPWGDEVYLKDVIAWCYLPKYRGVDNE